MVNNYVEKHQQLIILKNLMLTLVFLEIKFQIFHSNIATLDFVVLLFIQKCGVLREISPLTGDAIPIHVFLVLLLFSF